MVKINEKQKKINIRNLIFKFLLNKKKLEYKNKYCKYINIQTIPVGFVKKHNNKKANNRILLNKNILLIDKKYKNIKNKDTKIKSGIVYKDQTK